MALALLGLLGLLGLIESAGAAIGEPCDYDAISSERAAGAKGEFECLLRLCSPKPVATHARPHLRATPPPVPGGRGGHIQIPSLITARVRFANESVMI